MGVLFFLYSHPQLGSVVLLPYRQPHLVGVLFLCPFFPGWCLLFLRPHPGSVLFFLSAFSAWSVRHACWCPPPSPQCSQCRPWHCWHCGLSRHRALALLPLHSNPPFNILPFLSYFFSFLPELITSFVFGFLSLRAYLIRSCRCT